MLLSMPCASTVRVLPLGMLLHDGTPFGNVSYIKEQARPMEWCPSSKEKQARRWNGARMLEISTPCLGCAVT
jgi:hypothetical protein